MIKEEIIKQFDALTKELFGDYGFSEILNPRCINTNIKYHKERIGFINLDPEIFREYIESHPYYEKLDVVLSDNEDPEALYCDEGITMTLELNEMVQEYHSRELMFNYLMKIVLKYFPDAIYHFDTIGEFNYVFRLDR